MTSDSQPEGPLPLDWHHTIRSLGTGGAHVDRQATADECARLQSDLGVLAVDHFHARYELTPKSGGCFRFSGDFVCVLDQACVVTLEPVRQNISETFAVSFCPTSRIVEPEGKERPIIDEPDVEPLTGDCIETGRVLYELLSAAIEPYPRKDEAAFGWTDPKTKSGDLEKLNPFAALAKLKTDAIGQ